MRSPVSWSRRLWVRRRARSEARGFDVVGHHRTGEVDGDEDFAGLFKDGLFDAAPLRAGKGGGGEGEAEGESPAEGGPAARTSNIQHRTSNIEVCRCRAVGRGGGGGGGGAGTDGGGEDFCACSGIFVTAGSAEAALQVDGEEEDGYREEPEELLVEEGH
ncbi:hypothetical protein Ga0100231_017055 [Opitutaceae bacterium TAV4]|nr:hypothetical protein Ga0100231_017055 [Opitutaceae bacterium TAV4]